LENLKALEVQE